MSAIDRAAYESNQQNLAILNVMEILAERDTLAARVHELEAQCAMWRGQALWTQEQCDAAQADYEAAISGPVSITPRKCGTAGRACFVAGWEAAIEAAANCLETATTRDRSDIAISIRDLTAPADCGGCNPPEPRKETFSEYADRIQAAVDRHAAEIAKID